MLPLCCFLAKANFHTICLTVNAKILVCYAGSHHFVCCTQIQAPENPHSPHGMLPSLNRGLDVRSQTAVKVFICDVLHAFCQGIKVPGLL